MCQTFSVVDMRTAYLVHEQHEDEAQDQRDADAGMELLVAVLMFPSSTKSCFSFNLRLRGFHNSNLTRTVVVSTWTRKTCVKTKESINSVSA